MPIREAGWWVRPVWAGPHYRATVLVAVEARVGGAGLCQAAADHVADCDGSDGMFSMRQLDIYLNDHLAGAMVGVELSRRVAKSNRATPSGEFLGRLHREIVEDRRTLQAVVQALGAERSPMKPAFAWIAEKAGRLKLNGQIRGHSPLSRLVELEGLEIGVAGKRSLWQALSRAFPDDARLAGFDLDALVTRRRAAA